MMHGTMNVKIRNCMCTAGETVYRVTTFKSVFVTNFQVDLLDDWFVRNFEIVKNLIPNAVFIVMAMRWYSSVCCTCDKIRFCFRS
jgi:hypothetical protein